MVRLKFLENQKSIQYYQEILQNIILSSHKDVLIKFLESSNNPIQDIKNFKHIPNSMLPAEIQRAVDKYALTMIGKGMIIYEYFNDLHKYMSQYLNEAEVLFLLIQRDFAIDFSAKFLNEQLNIVNLMDDMSGDKLAVFEMIKNKCQHDRAWRTSHLEICDPLRLDQGPSFFNPLLQYVVELKNLQDKYGVNLRVFFPQAVLNLSPNAPTPDDVCREIRRLAGNRDFYCNLTGLGQYYTFWKAIN